MLSLHLKRSEADSTISYAPRTDADLRHSRAHRATRALIWLALFTLLAAVGWRFAKQIHYLYWQQKAMTFTMPAGQMYDGKMAAVDESANVMSHLVPDRPRSNFVFVHERRSAGGARYLVTVAVDGNYLGPALLAESYLPASLSPKSTMQPIHSDLTWQQVNRMEDLKIYVGQPDASDQSHFVIPILRAGQKGIVDGWLNDDGSLVLEERRS